MYRYRCVLFRYHTLLKFALPLCSYQIRESMNETRWDNIDLWWWRMTIAAGGTQEAGEDPDHPECWCWSGDILGATVTLYYHYYLHPAWYMMIVDTADTLPWLLSYNWLLLHSGMLKQSEEGRTQNRSGVSRRRPCLWLVHICSTRVAISDIQEWQCSSELVQ